MNHKISKKEIEDFDSTRLKIIYTIWSNKPMTIADISKKLNIDKELVFHHLKKLKNEFILIEIDKKYTLQTFFYDANIMEILNYQMKSIILIILKELHYIKDENELIKAIENNLETFIQTFSIELKS